MNITTKTGKNPFRLACLGAVLGLLTVGSAEATLFSFSGSDAGGTGSATIDAGILGNVLTLKLDNTSPLQLDNNTGTNTPGITGFGVNIGGTPTLSSWSLTAFNTNGTGPLIIGASSGGTGDWILNTTIAGVTLDFLPTTSGSNIQGALYNPLATSGFSALPNYETQAILTLTFLSAPVLAEESCFPGPNGATCTTFVRFQAVGNGGSLRLPGSTGTPSTSGEPPNAPEPSSLTLLGLGLIASVFALRRRSLQA